MAQATQRTDLGCIGSAQDRPLPPVAHHPHGITCGRRVVLHPERADSKVSLSALSLSAPFRRRRSRVHRAGQPRKLAARVSVVTGPRIAIGPQPWDEVVEAVREAGGEPAGISPDADALVWLDAADLDGLTKALAAAPAARWVQLPFAGVELVAGAGLLDPARTWTCAKGAYAEPVAEHALMLALAGLRFLRRRIRVGSPLFGSSNMTLEWWIGASRVKIPPSLVFVAR